MKTRLLNILARMNGINLARQKFLLHIFVLFISLPGRINFLNMARYGSYSEKTYRTHFGDSCDFLPSTGI